MHHAIKLFAWIFVAVAVAGIASARGRGVARHFASPSVPGDDGSWYGRMKPFCNSLEVVTRMQADPPPASVDGLGHAAACYALAGRIDSARALIFRVQPADRYRAAGVVFDIGHPVADMGDDRSAGPMMGLVVEFWPNHYMALYHAGASAYQVGDFPAARTYLEEFARVYATNDGWSGSASAMLRELRSGGVPRSLPVIP